MKINLLINGLYRSVEVEPGEYLLDTLRKINMISVRRGCDNTSCGVCTVLIEGKPVPSCSYLSVRADGKSILTVEGIAEEAEKISSYFGEEGAEQCGFCNPSIALTVYALKKEIKNPTDEQVDKYLVSNLCRCTVYISQKKAIKNYLGDKS